MPIYEYRCPKGHLFELFQRMDDPQPEVCEVCGKGPLEKVLHAVPVFFKGSGFYSTDYGRKGKRRDSSDGSAPKSDESVTKKDKEEKKPKPKPAEA